MNPKDRDGLTINTRQKLTLVFLRLGKGAGVKTYGKRSVVAMLNEYKQLHNLDVFGAQDLTIMSRQ